MRPFPAPLPRGLVETSPTTPTGRTIQRSAGVTEGAAELVVWGEEVMDVTRTPIGRRLAAGLLLAALACTHPAWAQAPADAAGQDPAVQELQEKLAAQRKRLDELEAQVRA